MSRWFNMPLSIELAMVALFLASISPVLMVAIPAMADYPNHLARMHLLFTAGTPDANPFYQVQWWPYTNRAMDFVVPWLARLTGVELATRCFLLASQVLVVSGTVALEIAVKGRHHLSFFVSLLVLYSLPFAWGFLNFEFGIGVALWGMAFWIGLRDRSWLIRAAGHILFVCVATVAHIFSLGIYGFTIGVYELWRAKAFGDARAATLNLALLGIPPAIAFVALVMSGPTVAGGPTVWVGDTKLQAIYHLISGYSTLLSATIMLSLCVMVAFYRKAFSVVAPGGVLGAAFLLLFIIMPFRLSDGTYADWRVLLAALLIVPAFLVISSNKALTTFIIVVSCAALGNAAHVTWVWQSYRGEYEALKRSFALLPVNATVLIAYGEDGSDPPANLYDYPMYQGPTLAAHYLKAFVPSLFTHPGQHSIARRPERQHLGTPVTGPTAIRQLRDIAHGGDSDVPPYLRAWYRDFCYLYVVGMRTENPIPELLQELAAGGRFVLYRIVAARRPISECEEL